jgi:anti-sigma factor RsiW
MMRLMMRLSRKAGISCARVQELVQAYLDGELEDGPERDRLVAHLDRCRPCGVEAEIYERIKASLAPDPPASSVDRLRQFAASIPGRADTLGGVDSPDIT